MGTRFPVSITSNYLPEIIKGWLGSLYRPACKTVKINDGLSGGPDLWRANLKNPNKIIWFEKTIKNSIRIGY